MHNAYMAQQTLSDGEEVRGEIMIDGQIHVQLVEADDGWRVDELWPESEEDGRDGTLYENRKTAELHVQLWAATGGHVHGKVTKVPLAVAKLGKPALAAWLRTGACSGIQQSASNVGDQLGVSEHTVNGYLSKVRGGKLDGGAERRQHDSRADAREAAGVDGESE